MVVGLGIRYRVLKFTAPEFSFDGFNDEYVRTDISLGASNFWRYYFTSGTVMPFLEVFGGIGTTRYSSNSSETVFKENYFQYGGGAGLALRLGDNVTFDTMLNWSSRTRKNNEDNPQNIRTISNGLNFTTGFSIYLN